MFIGAKNLNFSKPIISSNLISGLLVKGLPPLG